MGDERMVKVYHSDKPLESLDVRGFGEFPDGFDLVREWFDTVFGYSVSEEIYFRCHFRGSKTTLFDFVVHCDSMFRRW